MNPDEYIERNIRCFLEVADRASRPTVPAVQRVCRIGYNQAFNTLEEMQARGIVTRAEPWEWQWV